jgi:hypothetical protein
MYSRYKAEPKIYAEQVALYNSLNKNYRETKRFSDVPRARSPIDIMNIYHNFSYISRAVHNGTVGPTLIFYEADAKNYMPYEYSSAIRFDKASKAFDRYYVKGLSAQEKTGIWTSGKETEFLFYLSSTDSNLNLSFNVSPLVGESLPAQNVEIIANNESLGTLEIGQAGTYDITIPNSILAGDSLDLKFLLHTAISPKDLQINDDSRVLSLFFYAMSIGEIQS